MAVRFTLEHNGTLPGPGWNMMSHSDFYEYGSKPGNTANVIEDDNGDRLEDVPVQKILDWVTANKSERGGDAAIAFVTAQAAAHAPPAGGTPPPGDTPPPGGPPPLPDPVQPDLDPDTRVYLLVNIKGGGRAPEAIKDFRLVPEGTQLPREARVHCKGTKQELIRWNQTDPDNRGGKVLGNVLLLLSNTDMVEPHTAYTLFAENRRQRGGNRKLFQNKIRIAYGIVPSVPNFEKLKSGPIQELAGWIQFDPRNRVGDDLIDALYEVETILGEVIVQHTPAPTKKVTHNSVTQPATPVPTAPANKPSPWTHRSTIDAPAPIGAPKVKEEEPESFWPYVPLALFGAVAVVCFIALGVCYLASEFEMATVNARLIELKAMVQTCDVKDALACVQKRADKHTAYQWWCRVGFAVWAVLWSVAAWGMLNWNRWRTKIGIVASAVSIVGTLAVAACLPG